MSCGHFVEDRELGPVGCRRPLPMSFVYVSCMEDSTVVIFHLSPCMRRTVAIRVSRASLSMPRTAHNPHEDIKKLKECLAHLALMLRESTFLSLVWKRRN
jgi:hypothetical protein